MGQRVQDQTLPASVAGPAAWEALPAAQQPQWRQHPDYLRAREVLASASPLVTVSELETVEQSLARVAVGGAHLLQAGDCAESFAECTPMHAAAKVDTLDCLGDHLEAGIGQPVVRIGRLGGQFAKPRSQPMERHGDVELPAFRGHLVNSELSTKAARQHDPRRMLWAYEASAKVLGWLRSHREHRECTEADFVRRGPWSSHEALVIDYEGGAIRSDPATGVSFLGSTHLPWLGERTRQPYSAHVRLLSSVRNPVGCKIGPSAGVVDVLRLCELLDPDRMPGRLVLIVRMGKDRIVEALPPIAAAVSRAGHSVVWLSDPMHGNTVRAATGVKTRYLDDMIAEAATFREILERQGQHPGGLHLEVAASAVTECIGGPVRDEAALPCCSTSLCDPRLNPEQALELLDAWT